MLPFAAAQEFDPVVRDTSYPWTKIILSLVIILAFFVWWRKKSQKAKAKREEETKWVGKKKINYWQIAFFLIFLFFIWFYFVHEPGRNEQQSILPPTLSSQQKTPQTQAEKQPEIEIEESIVEQQSKPDLLQLEEKMPRQLTETKKGQTQTISSGNAEKELSDAKRLISDVFKQMAKAQSDGKDIRTARKLYGEANTLYYRAYLALKQERYQETSDLSQQAKQAILEAKAQLPQLPGADQ